MFKLHGTICTPNHIRKEYNASFDKNLLTVKKFVNPPSVEIEGEEIIGEFIDSEEIRKLKMTETFAFFRRGQLIDF